MLKLKRELVLLPGHFQSMTTIKKDLRSGASVWSDYTMPAVKSTHMKADQRCDVLVIGAGITGAFMAEELSAAGFSVTIVDRRTPLQGSTLATTALLQYEIDRPLTLLARQIGYEKAVRSWRRSKLALQSLAEKTQFLNIECGLKKQDSLYIAGNVLKPRALEKEQQALQQIGLQTGFLKKAQLDENYGIKGNAALHSLDNFSANPYQMAAGYLKKSIERGVEILSPVEITKIEPGARRVHVRTKTGFTISARFVVFTTGYEVPKQLESQNYKIYSTWALATKPQSKKFYKNLPMIWEASDPYLYIRSTPDRRIICGGEDEEFSDEEKRKAMSAQKIKKLQTKLERLLPGIDPVADYAWSGSFGVTPTGLPLIGPIPGLAHCYAVMAFGGNGIINGRIGAEIIRAYLKGKPDPDTDLYQFRV